MGIGMVAGVQQERGSARRLKWHTGAVGAVLLVLAACAGQSPSMRDARAQTLLAMPVAEYFGERQVALELAQGCPRYGWDKKFDSDMNAARSQNGAGSKAAARQPGAIALETDVKRRSLGAKYDAPFSQLNKCEVLDQETARQSLLSLMVVKKG